VHLGKGNVLFFAYISIIKPILNLHHYTLLFHFLGWNEACMCFIVATSSF